MTPFLPISENPGTVRLSSFTSFLLRRSNWRLTEEHWVALTSRSTKLRVATERGSSDGERRFGESLPDVGGAGE